jgi:hypothetical protein
MGERLRGIADTTAIEPSIAVLLRESPPNISKGRLCVSASRLKTLSLDKSPGDMRQVCFLTATRERRRTTAPATFCVLHLHQPVGGGEHRTTVNVTELRHASGESHEDLAGIECDWDDRSLTHHSTLEASSRELDTHQPIEHPSGTLA